MVKSNNRSNWQKKATLHVQPLFCTFLHRCFARLQRETSRNILGPVYVVVGAQARGPDR